MTSEPVTLDPAIDKNAIRARYAEERDKRLRPDGMDQFQRLDAVRGHEHVIPRHLQAAAQIPRNARLIFHSQD